MFCISVSNLNNFNNNPRYVITRGTNEKQNAPCTSAARCATRADTSGHVSQEVHWELTHTRLDDVGICNDKGCQ